MLVSPLDGDTLLMTVGRTSGARITASHCYRARQIYIALQPQSTDLQANLRFQIEVRLQLGALMLIG